MNKRSAEHNDNKIEKKVKKKTFNKIMNNNKRRNA